MKDYFVWAKEGSCAVTGTNPELFSKPKDDYDVLEAKRVCRLKCPVRSDCLAHAIIYVEAGVWGGYSEAERDEMSKDGLRERLAEIAKRGGIFHEEFIVKPFPVSSNAKAA